ncbi:outer membrane receptor protein [Spongiibacter sp. IMCC21906]|uniref:TonB-dependent receptor n=1 Tax=Spongiibacter sp. IMCC21906 TaxID=1620392 RepID=UPI00062DCF81|nr:TonB-dependent receptor [Spongiibacter sp. IMCC21906]AKH68371.1 outer membrane receptor protein [Spongiibacter sp. IMCC21906]
MKNSSTLVLGTSKFSLRYILALPSVILLGLGASSTYAAGGAASAMMEEVVVTARKKGVEDVQDVPLTLKAFGESQLEALNFKNISSLGFTIPNVALDTNGATVGFQNFAIRGLGVNSGSPSIDPTVGVFIDGVYLGTNAGVLLDNFDLEAVEVLRGPQGVLFGRNVTGGAVLVRTKRPTDEFSFDARFTAETGLQTTSDFTVSGPLGESGWKGKLAMYYTDDDGWYTNDFDGSDHGAAHQLTVRPALAWDINDDAELLIRYEHTTAASDGSIGQNRALFDRDSFDFAMNESGFSELEVDGLTTELNWNVGFGTFTNILAWRELTNDALGDIDSTPMTSFHFYQITEQEQFSNEFRFTGSFGDFDVTSGLYYFTQSLLYIEERILAGGDVIRGGGGEGDTDVLGIFNSVDWHVNDKLTLNFGLRYTEEEKDVDIGTIRTDGGSYASRDFIPDFNDDESWHDLSPRIGFQYFVNDDINLYGAFSRGFRSGGYNFRSTVPGAPPGPFDSEEQDSFELGLKSKFLGGRGQLNAAIFHNTIKDIQREVQVPIEGAGIAQLIQNVGEVEIQGIELDGQVAITDYIIVGGFVGYLDDQYKSLRFDIDGDGEINSKDKNLHLPRASKLTYGAHVIVDTPVKNFGMVSSRLSYSHRDKAYHLENNLGYYNPVDMLDLNISILPDDSKFRYAIFARNLLDEVNSTNDSLLPDIESFGGDGDGPLPTPSFTSFNEGRVIGVEVRYQF